MRDPSGFWVLSLLVLGVVVLALVHRRHAARVRADRGRLFEYCSGLLEDPVLVRRGLDFPLLEGRRSGHDVRIEPVLDTLSMRTLPVLWLVVTIGGPHPVPGRLSVLARACGTEFYDWPGELSVRSDGSDVVTECPQPLDRVRVAMTDGTLKQVVVGPASTRAVWKCATADSGSYRVTRRVDLTHARVDVRALKEVLTALDEVVELFRRCVAPPAAVPRRAVR
jgi:hypothetical protein